MYAIVLSEGDDPSYTTFHTFSDQRIWDQLHSLVPHSESTSWTVPVPTGVFVGSDHASEVPLTIGSYENDYAIAITAADVMTLVATDPEAGYAALAAAGIDAEHTYTGLYY